MLGQMSFSTPTENITRLFGTSSSAAAPPPLCHHQEQRSIPESRTCTFPSKARQKNHKRPTRGIFLIESDMEVLILKPLSLLMTPSYGWKHPCSMPASFERPGTSRIIVRTSTFLKRFRQETFEIRPAFKSAFPLPEMGTIRANIASFHVSKMNLESEHVPDLPTVVQQ